jgi:hypothetical protein
MAIEFRDEVYNKVSGVQGVVDAVYIINDITYIDVISGTEIHYESPIENWVLIKKCDE